MIRDCHPRRTLLVVGYGSLMSGYGLLAVRRGGRGALRAHNAFPLLLRNAQRGLAKPSSHGDYLAMDLEPLDGRASIRGRVGMDPRDGEIGALGLEFDRARAEALAQREEYKPSEFLRLLELADLAAQPLGEYLYTIARRVNFDFLAYRRSLFEMLGYTSPGYIFHPLPLDDCRTAIVAIGSGFDGSGDPASPSRRQQAGMDRLLTLAQALELSSLQVDHHGQLDYFVECLLGGMHGIRVHDQIAALDFDRASSRELAERLSLAALSEKDHFLEAVRLTPAGYRERFGDAPRSGLDRLLAILDALG